MPLRSALALVATCLISCCLRTPVLAAAAAEPPSLDVPVLDAPPAMTGTVDPSWASAAHVSLSQDFTYRRDAEEATTVYVAQDKEALDIAFVAVQREPLQQAQVTNGSSVTSDDYVMAYIWPQGVQGFAYSFAANPRGTRYQTSSENSAYTPPWTAVAERTADGYTVTMRIPLNVIRAGGSKTWRVQFVRECVATNGLSVWTYSDRQQNVNDPAFAGTLANVGIAGGVSSRPKARAQVYGLGELTTPSQGGSTSRLGADFSLPVTPTASFLGTLHPDYSNVEIDQQTIAPNAFAYQYQEVRPFFTQAAQAFNYNFSCSNCPQLLYSPAIPTFREGYALEGTQGPFTFGAYDAVGDGRADQGQAFDYNLETKDNYYSANLQRVAVDESTGLHDDLTSLTTGVSNQRTHFFVYANAAMERGSLVSDAPQANYAETGVGYVNATTTAVANYQTLGSQFAPVDSFVAQSGITGYELFAKRVVNFSPHALLHDVSAQTFDAWYRSSEGGPGQRQIDEQLFFDFRNLTTLRFFANNESLRTADGEYLPFNGNSVLFGYKYATNTPTYVQYTAGPYYHGTLDAWSYVSTLPLRRDLKVRLEADRNDYLSHLPGEPAGTQWLERATLDWQLSRDASFDLGVRRIIGRTLPNAFAPPPFPFINGGNVTAAFHFLAAKNEFYAVYGDPNSLATTPALYLKWIRYIGAPKGT